MICKLTIDAEGFGSDPYLQGKGASHVIEGIQSVGAMACGKFYMYSASSATLKFKQQSISWAMNRNISDKDDMLSQKTWMTVHYTKYMLGHLQNLSKSALDQ